MTLLGNARPLHRGAERATEADCAAAAGGAADRSSARREAAPAAESLRPLLRETRELAVLTAKSYDRSYHKHEKYTLLIHAAANIGSET